MMIALFLELAAACAFGADPQAGRAKAAACGLCHGQNGISVNPATPNLAGQPAMYVEEQLKNYRAGKRRHELMGVIAKPLTDAEIADLAAWYAAIKVEANVPK
jgi:cytochrome c553